MGVKIKKIEYYLPEKILTNEMLEKEFSGGWNAQKIEEKVGIRERHISSDAETSLDMGHKAAEKLLEGECKGEIDFLLLCTQSPDYYLPTSACILQDHLGLKTDTGALDLNLGCSGFIYGLAVAKGLINSNVANEVLLVTAETYSKFIHPLDKSTRTIFGDGAAATLVAKSEKNQIYDFILGTDGSGYENLIVPNGGMRNRYDPNSEVYKDEYGNIRSKNNLYMNGQEIFNFTIKKVPDLIKSVLKKNNLSMNDIDYVIFHQANKYMNEYLREKCDIPEEKYHFDMMFYGNTVSSTIPIALKDVLDRNIIHTGNKVLLAGFGVGYSWGATIIEI